MRQQNTVIEAPRTESGAAPADEHDRTMVFADRAMVLIKAFKLPATPRIYEFCYAYATGEYPSLSHIFDGLLSRRAAVDKDEIEEIGARYVSPTGLDDQIYSVGLRVAHEVDRVLTSLGTVIAAMDACSPDFDLAEDRIEAARRRNALVTLVEQMMRSANTIDQETRILDTRLNASNCEIHELRDELQAIRTAAMTDPLTELPNRTACRGFLEEALVRTHERRGPLCLALGDLDGLTAFNDAWGLDRGDQVMRLVAAEMKQKVEKLGIVARAAGPQFAILMPFSTANAARTVLEQIRTAVMQREVKIRTTNENLGRVSISFGLANARPGDSADTLTARARACLRAAKVLGRNRTVCDNDPEFAGRTTDAAVA